MGGDVEKARAISLDLAAHSNFPTLRQTDRDGLPDYDLEVVVIPFTSVQNARYDRKKWYEADLILSCKILSLKRGFSAPRSLRRLFAQDCI